MQSHQTFSKIQFAHFRVKDFLDRIQSHGGVTIAFVTNGPEMRYATAVCALEDQFSRPHGRRMAAGRLEVGKGSSIEMDLIPDDAEDAPKHDVAGALKKIAALKFEKHGLTMASEEPSVTVKLPREVAQAIADAELNEASPSRFGVAIAACQSAL